MDFADSPRVSVPFPWFDDALTHMPAGWMWEEPGWGLSLWYDEDGTLEQCTRQNIYPPTVRDRMLLRRGLVLVSLSVNSILYTRDILNS